MELGYPCCISMGIITSFDTNSSFAFTYMEWLGLPGRLKKIHAKTKLRSEECKLCCQRGTALEKNLVVAAGLCSVCACSVAT